MVSLNPLRNRFARRALLATLAASAALVWFSYERANAPTWSQVHAWTALRHPSVAEISTAALAAYLATPPADQRLLLVDVRSDEEFAVSRIPGAIHVRPEDIDSYARSLAGAQPSSTTIIVYCAVGIRSATAAQVLQSSGFTNVFNLRGSIFAWANEGRALEGTTRVHPYDNKWGRLLKNK